VRYPAVHGSYGSTRSFDDVSDMSAFPRIATDSDIAKRRSPARDRQFQAHRGSNRTQGSLVEHYCNRLDGTGGFNRLLEIAAAKHGCRDVARQEAISGACGNIRSTGNRMNPMCSPAHPGCRIVAPLVSADSATSASEAAQSDCAFGLVRSQSAQFVRC
jgi:hypothetical protein